METQEKQQQQPTGDSKEQVRPAPDPKLSPAEQDKPPVVKDIDEESPDRR